MKWASLAEQLHSSLRSLCRMPTAGWSKGVKPAGAGIWNLQALGMALLNKLIQVYKSGSLIMLAMWCILCCLQSFKRESLIINRNRTQKWPNTQTLLNTQTIAKSVFPSIHQTVNSVCSFVFLTVKRTKHLFILWLCHLHVMAGVICCPELLWQILCYITITRNHCRCHNV